MTDGITTRIYVFDADDHLHRLAQQVYTQMLLHEESLPALANTTVRVAYAVVEDNEERQEILRLIGERWGLDNWGRFDEATITAQRASLQMKISRMPSFSMFEEEGIELDPGVIDMSLKFAEQNARRWSWEPTDREVTRIIHDLWPETAGKEVEISKYLKPGRRKRVPLTRLARHRKNQIASHLSRLRTEFNWLGVRDIRSVIDSVEEEQDPLDQISNLLWAGVADALRYDLACQRARASSKGVWYAVVEIFEHVGDAAWEARDYEAIRCEGREAAEEKCREFLKDNAHRFSATMRVEVELRPELEMPL